MSSTITALLTRALDEYAPAGPAGPALPPAASIVIVSYNSRHHLGRCLDSIWRTTGPDCEVVVVDNASTDGTADFVADIYPQVRLIRNTTNAGFAAGNNCGVAATAGRYIVALNPDTEVTPGWLEALLAPFSAAAGNRTARVGLTTPRILMMDPRDRVNTCGNQMHYSGLTVCRGLGVPAASHELDWPCEVSAVSGACFAIRRDLWDTLGGFDEAFFTYLEDTDLSLRARLAGYTCVYVPGSTVYHAYTNTFSATKLFYLERNRLLMLAKSYRLRTLLFLLPGLLLAEVITWGYALLRGPRALWAKLHAYGWLLGHGRAVRAMRRRTQAVRHSGEHEILAGLSWRLDISQLAGPGLGAVAAQVLNPCFLIWYRLARRMRLA